jgi:hypothetical protein
MGNGVSDWLSPSSVGLTWIPVHAVAAFGPSDAAAARLVMKFYAKVLKGIIGPGRQRMQLVVRHKAARWPRSPQKSQREGHAKRMGQSAEADVIKPRGN